MTWNLKLTDGIRVTLNGQERVCGPIASVPVFLLAVPALALVFVALAVAVAAIALVIPAVILGAALGRPTPSLAEPKAKPITSSGVGVGAGKQEPGS